MKGSRVESIEEARNEYKKLLEEGWEKTYRFNSFFKQWWLGTLPEIWHYSKLIARSASEWKFGYEKDIYSNIIDSDALESLFDCITSCSINSEGVDCTTKCYVKHLEPNNIDYPLKIS